MLSALKLFLRDLLPKLIRRLLGWPHARELRLDGL
jgi:hypothetical protein